MPRSLRLKLDPIPNLDPQGPREVEGVRLQFADLGRGSSLVSPARAADAKITFRVALRKMARETSEPERQELGSLTGQIELRGDDLSPVFVIAPEAAATALTLTFDDAAAQQAPPPAEGVDPGSSAAARRPKPRALTLELDSGSFDGTNELPESRLLIPSEALAGFHFLELEAELEIEGSPEGTFALNDVLDGRITPNSPPPLPTFDVLLVDDVAQPLDGVALRFEVNGKESVVTTDATGFARLVADEDGEGNVRIDDLSALRARMKPEWDKADRDKGHVIEPIDEHTTVFAIRGDESPRATLDTETPHVIRVQPYVFLARLKGMFFDTNKTFLLPSALRGLKDLRSIYDANSPGKLLVVGHTDTSGSAANNDTLALDRARSVAAFLADETPFWEQQYGSGTAEARRWGRHEDEQMIEALPDFQTGRQPPTEKALSFFQRTRGFPAAASLGQSERKQLITEYMALDGADVKDQALDIQTVSHGAGENFPLDATGEQLDAQPADEQHEQLDRRVELFFFDKDLGVQPVVADGSTSKPKSLQYPEWRRRAATLQELEPAGGARDRVISVVLLSNSGNVPLVNRTVTLNVTGDPPFSGSTDANGVFEKLGVPPGDHLLTVDGISCFVSATPASIVQRPHVIAGHVLIDPGSS